MTTMLQTASVLLSGLVVRVLLAVLALCALAAAAWTLLVLFDSARAAWRYSRGERMVSGLPWASTLAYTSEHSWLRPLRRGRVRVGLDGVAQRLLSGPHEVRLPAAGTRLREGEAAVEVRCASGVAHLPAPLDGEVTRVNAALALAPQRLGEDPYGGGWLYEVAPSGGTPAWLHRGEAARQWFAREAAALTRDLESSLGIAAADGGELLHPARSLPHERWRRLVQVFLHAA